MAIKAWQSPTKSGCQGFRDRFIDALGAIAFQLGVSAYKDMGDGLVNSVKGIRGSFERLYENEVNPAVREMFRAFVEPFRSA